jgi:hypothetical protein
MSEVNSASIHNEIHRSPTTYDRKNLAAEFNLHVDKEHLEAAFKEADRTGDDSLDYCFERLKVIAFNNGGHVNIFKDWANLSFAFSITEGNAQVGHPVQEHYGRVIINGGLIFHGHDGNRENNLTCTLDDNPQGWSIHT